MDFISNAEPQIEKMLESLGINNINELFKAIPEQIVLPSPSIDDGLSEFEGKKLLEEIASQNTYSHFDNYLGVGSYEHYVPSIVSSVCQKSGFLTAYTPYQAEASQGGLQTIYEFQSAICRLTGLDVANASVYDAGSALAEAALMAYRFHKKRKKILVMGSVNPQYTAVLEQYLGSFDVELTYIAPMKNGEIDHNKLESELSDGVFAVVFQFPNFFGLLEDIRKFTKLAKQYQALTIVVSNPLIFGLYLSSKELGASIAVGDTQPFGIPMQFGGPYVGYIAAISDLTRQMPGRIVGRTKDKRGKKCFVLTLQAREQHIRRDKATSNICSNQALCALASLVSMLWYGKKGLKELALTNFQRAQYLKANLEKLEGVSVSLVGDSFNEFVIKFNQNIKNIQQHFRTHGIEPGVDLGKFYPQFEDHLLICVTETKDKQQLDHYIEVAQNILA